MTKQQIDKLIEEGKFPEQKGRPGFLETHISWIIFCDRFAYKIKKPLFYSFLDFSTLEKRKYYCEREIFLNKRLTQNIYIDVQAISEIRGRLCIGEEEGEIIDYAVRMLKIDRNRQMDLLLMNKNVTHTDLHKLAEKMANFHMNTSIIYKKDVMEIQEKFLDLNNENDFLRQNLNTDSCDIISHAIEISTVFMQNKKELMVNRQRAGFFRDCHGDLHSRNIFFLPEPQPFDCIEFNDDYRQIDVLNEIAFLCMDLDAFGREDLSGLFLSYYNHFFNTMKTREDQLLFIYYKSYRANIRAKVNSLRARSCKDNIDRSFCLTEAGKYLKLMKRYINMLEV
jgi:aminoglycoside phosphotransferase family enzyme